MSRNTSIEIRYATLDDVEEIIDLAGENEIHTKFLHEAILSDRQRVYILKSHDNIKGFIRIHLAGEGVKIDGFKFPEDQDASLRLLGEIEKSPYLEKIYTFLPKNTAKKPLFKKLGYEERTKTDSGDIKMVKPWSKIYLERKKEEEYMEKVKEVEDRYKVLQPRSEYSKNQIDRNVDRLDDRIKEMNSEDKVRCPECGDLFDTEKGMKIHKTKVHG